MSLSAIRRGSQLHETIALLRGMSSTPQQLMRVLGIEGRRERDAFIDDTLTPLFVRGLAERDGHAWKLTDLGIAAADQLGPFGREDAPQRRASAVSAEHELLASTTPCKPRLTMGNGDARPALPRPGSMDARTLPSRRGNRLYWPNGRVTDLSGRVELQCGTA